MQSLSKMVSKSKIFGLLKYFYLPYITLLKSFNFKTPKKSHINNKPKVFQKVNCKIGASKRLSSYLFYIPSFFIQIYDNSSCGKNRKTVLLMV